jgi:LacI family transcriptional regulator/LacI family purine nucleotide synthesis repressor
VPEDISVAGYDNYIHPDLCDIAITSYEVDLKEMAKRCVEMLIGKLNNEGSACGIQMVEGRLVIKESVRRI